MGGSRDAAAPAVRELVGERLTTWSVSPDGSRAWLGFADRQGRPGRIDLPVEAVSGLLLTLPRILQHALDVSGDESARIVQPLGDWRLEQVAGSGRMILTLSTPDGFSVSFTVSGNELAAMAAMAETGREPVPAMPRAARVVN